jgi:hypothetical protein
MQKPQTAHVKGTDIVTIRGLLKEKSATAFQDCCNRLSPEAKRTFEMAVSTLWIPNALGTEIMEQAAAILYPDCKDDLEQLGGACAERAFAGIYQIFLRITSVPFLIKRVPSVWAMYHSVGQATVTVINEKTGAVMIVTGAQDVSVKNLRLVSGFSMRALELAGAKNLHCRLHTDDPKAWRWEFSWEA